MIVNVIVRLNTKKGEFLLSHGNIIGYSAFGDPVNCPVRTPEKYVKTNFRYDTVPNYDTGFQERRKMGPSGSEIVYTLPFTKENAKKLFDLRNSSKEDIQFLVKDENKGKVYQVAPQITFQDNCPDGGGGGGGGHHYDKDKHYYNKETNIYYYYYTNDY